MWASGGVCAAPLPVSVPGERLQVEATPRGMDALPPGQPRCSRSPRWRVGPRVAPAPPPRGGHAWAGRGRSGGAGAARRGARPQRAALGPARQRLPPPRHHVAAGHGAAAGRAGRGSESAELAGRAAAVGLWRWERGRRSITPRYREFVATSPPASEGGCARGGHMHSARGGRCCPGGILGPGCR